MLMIIKILLFLLGMSLMVQVIASIYGILDLWYSIKTVWKLVMKRIIIWGGLTVAIALLLRDNSRQAFLYGIFCYIGIYLAILLFSKLYIARMPRPIKMEDDKP